MDSQAPAHSNNPPDTHLHTAATAHAPQIHDAPTGTRAYPHASGKTRATTITSADSNRTLPAHPTLPAANDAAVRIQPLQVGATGPNKSRLEIVSCFPPGTWRPFSQFRREMESRPSSVHAPPVHLLQARNRLPCLHHGSVCSQQT